MNLFVLVSTGQNVANLPPVLEHAEPGDHVVWVESPQAESGNWSAGASAVLRRSGLEILGPVGVGDINDPSAIVNALGARVPDWERARYEQVFAVANGGRKLSPFGVLFGLRPLGPTLLYGDEPRTTCSITPGSFSEPPQAPAYTRHTLDLPDILEVRGYELDLKPPPTRIWPVVGGPPVPPSFATSLPTDAETERYGQDWVFTHELHKQHYENDLRKKDRRKLEEEPSKNLGFEGVQRHVEQEMMVSWLQAVQRVRKLEEVVWESHPEVKSLFGLTLNVEQAARRKATTDRLPEDRLGKPFEHAVARRVRNWLEANRHPAVQSAWLNVKFRNPRLRTEQELDVVLVLRNANLLHLDCKAATVDLNLLDSRLLRLQRAASQSARLTVVLPSYPEVGEQPWMEALQRARTKATEGGIDVLPFTMPKPPGSGIGSAAEDFETALDNLLRPYRP